MLKAAPSQVQCPPIVASSAPRWLPDCCRVLRDEVRPAWSRPVADWRICVLRGTDDINVSADLVGLLARVLKGAEDVG